MSTRPKQRTPLRRRTRWHITQEAVDAYRMMLKLKPQCTCPTSNGYDCCPPPRSGGSSIRLCGLPYMLRRGGDGGRGLSRALGGGHRAHAKSVTTDHRGRGAASGNLYRCLTFRREARALRDLARFADEGDGYARSSFHIGSIGSSQS